MCFFVSLHASLPVQQLGHCVVAREMVAKSLETISGYIPNPVAHFCFEFSVLVTLLFGAASIANLLATQDLVPVLDLDESFYQEIKMCNLSYVTVPLRHMLLKSVTKMSRIRKPCVWAV
jgi:hypothetical protein